MNIISETKYGVEIEMVISWNEIDKGIKFSHDILAKELTSLSGENVEYVKRNRHETKQFWKVVTDASVKDDVREGFELVSPPLIGRDGLVSISSVYEAAKKLGATVNSTCGFHVHINAENMSLSHLSSISHCFLALENAFDLLMNNVDRRGNMNVYCQSNSYHLYHSSPTQSPPSNKQRCKLFQEVRSMEELVCLVNQSDLKKRNHGNRYRKLNLTNLVRKDRPFNTIEFRQHGGVTSFEEAQAWIYLLLVFCQRNINNSNTMLVLPENASSEMEWNTLFDLLNCQYLREYYSHRLSSSTMSHHSIWMCQHCSKIFQDSKALSQHEISLGHFDCPYCFIQFRDKMARDQHVRDKHPNDRYY